MQSTLTDVEARVLGCLIEKEMTTPETYPLSLNALRNACCQKSNRAPLVQMEERDVLRAVDGLIQKKLAHIFHGSGGRVAKYKHRANETLFLKEPQIAILAELLLRGPQTIGELRTHASRMHAFDSIEKAEQTLSTLLEEPRQYITRLPVQPGRKEPRYMHLLCGEVAIVVPDETSAAREPARIVLQAEDQRLDQLEAETASLRKELEDLREAFQRFKTQFD